MGNPNTTTTESVKTNRTMRLVRAPHATEPGKLTITETKGRKTTTTDYTVELADSQIGGRAFLVQKLDESGEVVERYSVLVNGNDSRCDCAWGCYGANKKHCRHLAALTVLLATGKIDAPTVPTCKPVPQAFRCCVCHQNPVNPLDGFDTCDECILNQ